MAELTERQQDILKLIVLEYVRAAVPVASQSLLKNGGLKVSSATIRNDMAYLEELDFISHPHTSAGRIPTDRGYRYFVEWLMDEKRLSDDEQKAIRRQFQQVELDVAEWTELAASVLARTVKTASVVTLPAAPHCRLKHVQLVGVQDNVALLVIVLAEGTVRQQMLNFSENVDETELDKLGRRLTKLFRGRTADQIRMNASAMSASESMVKEHLAKAMSQVDSQKYQKVVFDGVVSMLSQPEFAQTDKMRQMVALLHSRGFAAYLAPEGIASDTVRVVIGQENPSEALQECTVIVSRYGVGSDISGMLGVLGPTRLPYERAISAVRYTCGVMNELMKEYF